MCVQLIYRGCLVAFVLQSETLLFRDRYQCSLMVLLLVLFRTSSAVAIEQVACVVVAMHPHIAARFNVPARFGAAGLGHLFIWILLMRDYMVNTVYKCMTKSTISSGGSLGSWVDEKRS